MTIDYEAAKRSLIATRRKNVHAAVDELVYDAERSAADAWANYDRAKARITELEAEVLKLKLELTDLLCRVAIADSYLAAFQAKLDKEGTAP